MKCLDYLISLLLNKRQVRSRIMENNETEKGVT